MGDAAEPDFYGEYSRIVSLVAKNRLPASYAFKRLGWSLFMPAAYVNRCGHARELLPIPVTDETAHLVPIPGEAS